MIYCIICEKQSFCFEANISILNERLIIKVMKMIFTSEDIVYLHHLKNILQAKEIDCVIKNDRLISISGEIPMGNCWPELWVVDVMYERWAKELIEQSRVQSDEEDTWVCKHCGEEHSSLVLLIVGIVRVLKRLSSTFLILLAISTSPLYD